MFNKSYIYKISVYLDIWILDMRFKSKLLFKFDVNFADFFI